MSLESEIEAEIRRAIQASPVGIDALMAGHVELTKEQLLDVLYVKTNALETAVLRLARVLDQR